MFISQNLELKQTKNCFNASNAFKRFIRSDKKRVEYPVSSAFSHTRIRVYLSIDTKLFWKTLINPFCLCFYCLQRKMYAYNLYRFRTPLEKLLCARTRVPSKHVVDPYFMSSAKKPIRPPVACANNRRYNQRENELKYSNLPPEVGRSNKTPEIKQ